MVITETLQIISEGKFFSKNITDDVRRIVKKSNINNGNVLVFYRHTTGAIIIVEHEVGFLVDFENILELLVPENGNYLHHRRGYDSNGAAHIRTAMMNISQQIPVVEGDLGLGKYQEILLLDMDTNTKVREVIIQVMGE